MFLRFSPYIPVFLITSLIGVGIIVPAGLAALLVISGAIGLMAVNGTDEIKKTLSSPIAIALVGLTLWASLSGLWAADPSRSVSLALKLFGLCVAGFVVLNSISRIGTEQIRRLENTFFISFLFAVAVLIIAASYAAIKGDSLWGIYSGDPLSTLSRSEAVLTLAVWPIAALALKRKGWKFAFLIIVLMALFFIFLSNSAALLSLASAVLVFGMVYYFKRRALTFLAGIFVLLIVSAPALVKALPSGDVMNEKVGSIYTSAVHRVYIWDFVTERILEKPLFGWGLDASRNIPGGDKKLNLDISSIWNAEILPLHPHNFALQVWLELGLPGALITAWLIWTIVRAPITGSVMGITDALKTSVTTAYLVTGGLSYGVWQNWWVSLAWIMAVLTVIAARKPEEVPPNSPE